MSHELISSLVFEAPRDFYTSLGAFFVRTLPGQDRKSVKTDKTEDSNANRQETQMIMADIHE